MVRSLCLALMTVGILGCSSENPMTFDGAPDPGAGAPGETAESSKTRNTSPNVSDEDLAALTGDNATFAWNFYHQVTKPGENLFSSPYSLSIALAMTYAGARANSEAEMAQALQFNLPQNQLHAAFNRLDLELAARADDADPNAPLPFTLNASNGLFGQAGFEFLPPFLDTLAEHYGAGMQLMDFATEAEEARQLINAWVSERTNDRIDQLLAPGQLSSLTRLVLVNAILFTASWADPFSEERTEDLPFRLLDGNETLVATMQGSTEGLFFQGDGFQAAEIPYDGGLLAMLVVVPNEGAFEAVESSLSGAAIADIRSSLSFHQISLSLPKFSFRSRVAAKGPLEALGMVEPFLAGVADLSGMDGSRDLYISFISHEAFIAVDERGTEAAAATAVGVSVTSAPPHATLTLDRPFIFAIIDRPTGAILFAGRVLDPTQ